MGGGTSNGPGPVADFQAAATARDTQAAEYFGSDAFLEQMKTHVQSALVNRGNNIVSFDPTIHPKKQDLPLIQQAFLKTKTEYPELNHVRIKGAGVVLDTKKNTRLRRFMTLNLY